MIVAIILLIPFFAIGVNVISNYLFTGIEDKEKDQP